MMFFMCLCFNNNLKTASHIYHIGTASLQNELQMCVLNINLKTNSNSDKYDIGKASLQNELQVCVL